MVHLAYKPNAGETLERLTRLVDRQALDRILAAFIMPSEAMKDFQKHYTGGFISEYPEPHERIAFWDRFLAERRKLEDDNIPSAYPSEFDQGLYGGLLGGEVRFLSMVQDGYVGSGWISSMVSPLLKDWSGFEGLSWDEGHVWFQRYKNQLRIMNESSRGKFGVAHIIVIDSLNFVYELVGATETYVSLYEQPQMVHRAVDFAYNLNAKIHDTFFDSIDPLHGGTCAWEVPWVPGRIVSESLDPFHMTSIDDFEKWGREPVERMISRYDGGTLHLHANGWHLLEAGCSIKGVKAILLVNEKDHAPAIERIHELRKRAGTMPLSIHVEYGTFAQMLDSHTLPCGIFYYVSGAPGFDAANACMEKVRAYRC
jgi:hypothetical protein